MPRYFFNTRIGNDVIPDPKGEILRDPDHAWEAARATIRELLKDGGSRQSLLTASVEVTDTSGDIVLEFPFSEVLFEETGDPPTRH